MENLDSKSLQKKNYFLKWNFYIYYYQVRYCDQDRVFLERKIKYKGPVPEKQNKKGRAWKEAEFHKLLNKPYQVAIFK